MIKRVCIIWVLIGLWPLGSAGAEDQLSKVLDGVLDRYGQLPGLAVTYEREVITKSMAMLGMQTKKDLATGRIYFKAPHFLRLEQETPRPETVINNGDVLWWYIPQKKEVYKYPAQKLGREMQVLNDIFQGLKKVRDSFDVKLVADSKEGYELKLTPNPPWEQIEYVVLRVDTVDFHIRVVESHDYLGGLTIFTLGNPVAKKTFEKNFFEFTVPEGVKVIEEGN